MLPQSHLFNGRHCSTADKWVSTYNYQSRGHYISHGNLLEIQLGIYMDGVQFDGMQWRRD